MRSVGKMLAYNAGSNTAKGIGLLLYTVGTLPFRFKKFGQLTDVKLSYDSLIYISVNLK